MARLRDNRSAGARCARGFASTVPPACAGPRTVPGWRQPRLGAAKTTPFPCRGQLCHTRYSRLDIARVRLVSSRGTQLLTRVFEPGGPKAPWAAAAGRSAVAPAASPAPAAKLAAPSRRRTQISDLHQSLHCSIIGTCLSSAELRRLLIRLEVQGAETADDHDLHMLGVLLAGKSKAGAKHLAEGARPAARACHQPVRQGQGCGRRGGAVGGVARARRYSGRLLGAAHPSGGDRHHGQGGVRQGAHAFAPRGRRQPGRHPPAAPAGGGQRRARRQAGAPAAAIARRLHQPRRDDPAAQRHAGPGGRRRAPSWRPPGPRTAAP